MTTEIQAEIVKSISELPGVFAMPVAGSDVLCSVKIVVERREKVDSGSMQFHHLRYLSFGQLVWFRVKDAPEQPRYDNSGAIAFTVMNAAEAVEYVKNIVKHIPHEKEDSETGTLIGEA